MADTFILTINTGSDAFQDGARLQEVSRILAQAASQLADDDREEGTLRDVNGNTVGLFGFEPEGGPTS